MKKLYNKTLYLVSIILLTASCNNSQVTTSEKQAELNQYKWTELSSKYENSYSSNGIQKNISLDVLSNWWGILEDETLTQLINLSLNNNKNLQEVRAKVKEARAALGISQAELLPWLDNNNSWERKKTSDNSPSQSGIASVYKLGIDASWEIDIFGGNQYKVEAAAADLQTQHAQLHSAWVTLTSEVAINYLSLRTLQERLSLAEANLNLQENTVQLLQSKYNTGLIDELALNQAKYTASQTKSTIPTIKISIEETLNNLAVLTGQLPGSLEKTLIEKKELPNINEMIYVGIPAETLRQRPDIQAAEYQLEAQIARTKSAKADLKPKLILFGSIGLESVSSGSLLSGASKGFSIGPQITLPIFHAGAIRKNIEVQSAKEEQYLAAYENTILNAVAEVRNALTAINQETEKNISLKEGVQTASLALEIAQEKYNNGLVDFQNVLDAQRALLSLQDQYATSKGQKISNLVGLFKALGGGWKPLTQEQTNIK
ncbi:efflux transporter outer membrane subunit [Fusobacterium varium]|uniref:efflux transporter outer membrane subunit n=1 Tax=Fusobacterium varium TaxID=856 RepID=UPI0035635A15